MRAKLLMGLMLLALSVGCGGTEGVVVEGKPATPADELKKTLEALVKSGEPLGSGGYTIQQAIDGIKATDKAKGDSLQPECDKLMSTTNPAEIKKIAESMLKKL
jgi:hypothetical protein